VVEVNPKNSRIYFSENYQNSIKSCKFDGSDLQTVISNAGLVMGIGIDTIQNLIFWADMSGHKLHKANLDGSENTVILETNLNVFDICLDIKYLYVYFTERTGEKVWRVSYYGTNLTEVHQGSNVVGALSINDDCNQLYWVERENGFIVTGTTTGTNREELIYWPGSQISGIDVGSSGFSDAPQHTQSKINVFPNPGAAQISIETSAGFNCNSIRIVNLQGQCVMQCNFSNSLDVSHLAQGMYVLCLYDSTYKQYCVRFSIE